MTAPIADPVPAATAPPASSSRRPAGCPSPGRGDEGSAMVEFLALAVLLLVPLLYLVITLGRVQAATMAVDGSARTAARVYVLGRDEERARRQAEATVALALRDHGFRPAPAALTVDCSTRPCPAPGAVVRVSVELDVLLPGVPAALDRVVPLHVTVRARQVAVVDDLRGVPDRGGS